MSSRRIFMLNAVAGSVVMMAGGYLMAQESSTVKATGKPLDKPGKHLTRMRQRNIKISARKFAFKPNHITIVKGEKIVLELTSIDMLHGFSIPDWNLRTDILPNQTATLTLNPDQEGEFVFLCDNFCGEGHETMSGKITVIAPT